ncbi:MAG: NUDIX hydrolase [Methanomassiliicoccaceae archaeon]|nr:NUDIX hydrolase [Methanomassiliicoccaceae archaeon]
MVFNAVRDGWEMPGGRIEENETPENAVKREFLEEAGYEIKILGKRDLGHCIVCACLLLKKTNNNPEMVSELFSELPAVLAFERSEYELVIPWAESVICSSRSK